MRPAPTILQPGLLFARMREHGLAEHAVAVSALARETCLALGLEAAERRRIERAALLHDLGKLQLPPELLEHPGPLGQQAVGRIREHPGIGEEVVVAVAGLTDLGPLVRSHHDRW